MKTCKTETQSVIQSRWDNLIIIMLNSFYKKWVSTYLKLFC